MIKDSGDRRQWNGQFNRKGDKRGCIVTHGCAGTRLYEIWCGMKKRCYNPKDKRFKNYGGRGITVCDEWKDDFKAFYDWSMSHGYSDDLTIDRIDNDGNYSPDNCRWVTRSEQNKNKRKKVV